MISTLLDLVAYGLVVAGTYWLWGRGVAALVAGVCVLLLSYSLADVGRRPQWTQHLRRETPPQAPRDQRVITNESLGK